MSRFLYAVVSVALVLWVVVSLAAFFAGTTMLIKAVLG